MFDIVHGAQDHVSLKLTRVRDLNARERIIMKSLLTLVRKGILYSVLLILILIGGRVVLGLLLKPASRALTAEEEELRTRALGLHHDAIVVDGHNDLSTSYSRLRVRSWDGR